MRLLSSLALGALIVAGAPAGAATKPDARGEARLAKALEGRVAGEPVRCIELSDIRSSEIFDHTAILYRTGRGQLYLNRPTAGLAGLNGTDVLVTKSVGPQLCSFDTVRLFDRGARFETGFVGLGAFVPYTKAASPSD